MMTERIPIVSIGLPVYNGERYLRLSIESIIAQSFSDFELIISDNASTDKTAEIYREFARKDPRIKCYRNEENLGAAANFNRVFNLARGKYFRWATADDLVAPDSLEHCVEVLDRQSEVVLSYAKTLLIDEFGNAIRHYDDNLDLRSASPVVRFRVAMKQMGLMNVQYGLIRSESLRRTRLMENYPGGDIPLLLELALYGQFWELPEVCFFRRIHKQALSGVTTLEGEQEFWDPKTKGKVFLRTWRHSCQYLRRIFRAPLRFTDRIRLVKLVLRSAIASRHEMLAELHCALVRLRRYTYLVRVGGSKWK